MEFNELLKVERRHGDIEFVAAIVGCSPRTIKSFLASDGVRSRRNIESPTGRRVVSAFKTLLEQRSELKKLHSKVA
jgi:hypothetical protein